MDKNKHIIQNVFLEINTNSMKLGNALKNNVDMLFKTELFSLIENELERFFSDKNYYLQIEKLDISLENIQFKNGALDSNELKESIKNQLTQKLELAKNQIKSALNDEYSNSQLLSIQEKNVNTLIYYLTHGELPWWASKNDSLVLTNENLDLFITSGNFKTQFKNILDKSIVQNRLINQFSNEQLARITGTLSDSKISILDNKIIRNLNQENNFQQKKLFWIAIFNGILYQNATTIIDFYSKNIEKSSICKLSLEEFISSAQQFVSFHPNSKETATTKPEVEPIEIKPSSVKNENLKQRKEYYIQNAGLILIHPFIKELFKNCRLLKEENTLIDKELAAHILHYTATKKEQDYEHTMIFEKFLCGIPIAQSIQREITITDFHKTQIEEMLQSVLEHWTALKSKSNDLLRNEFLQREGKLDLQENNPRLFIEKKTQDLLLEKIPWNIGITKIPWIEKLIYTDW